MTGPSSSGIARRDLIAASLTLPALLKGCDADAPVRRPNLVLVISDDHDWEHFGFLGHPLDPTPNLDRLARAGALFPHGHAMSRCRPALAGLLCGRYAQTSGVYYNNGPDLAAPPYLPELLRGAGYATFAQGKLFEPDRGRLGFEVTPGGEPLEFVRAGQADLFGFLARAQHPFFVWYAPVLPHVPHDPPERLLARFPLASIPVPERVPPAERAAFAERERVSLAMVAWLDEGVGDLVRELNATGHADDTVILFLADNGWANGDVSKGSPYEKGVRTPLFVHGRGIGPSVRDELVSHVDVMPTLLELGGLDAPAACQGRSLMPFVDGGAVAWRDALFGACFTVVPQGPDVRPERDVFAQYVRTERWKLVRWVRAVSAGVDGALRIKHYGCPYPERVAGQVELFDLAADPFERNDLAGTPEHEARIRELTARLDAWWSAT